MKRLIRLTLYAVFCLAVVGCANALHWRQYDYVVQPGDTLYSIAWHFDLDYRNLAAWNGIRSPYLIYPGEKLVLSRTPGFTASAPSRQSASSSPASPAPSPTSSSRRVATSESSEQPSRPGVKRYPDKVSSWRWPVSGDLIGGFDPDKVDAKGINIGGRLGEPVRAAAAGRVVYSGNGLTGYGELVIIKHSQHYLSAYAHNRKRLVKEGDKVDAGDEIGTMGRGDDGDALLHFEIRYDGKPVDPLNYLPKNGR